MPINPMLTGPTAGAMDGTALIEMLRSMSQVGYSSGASIGNGPVAPPQQQQGEPVSDAMLLPPAHVPQQPASSATAQHESLPGTHVPAEAQPAQAEPAQHADVPSEAEMDSGTVPQDAPGAQLEQGTAEGRKVASTDMLSGSHMPEPVQPAQPTSAAPPDGGSAAAQLPQQQQATEAPTVPEAAALPQLVPEAQAATEQHEVAAPPPGLTEQPVMPDGATKRALDAVQQAEDKTITQPSGVHAETSGNASQMKDGQDNSAIHDDGNGNASRIQAGIPELPATAEPALPAAASHVQAAILPRVAHTISHDTVKRDQTASTQQALPDSAGDAEHVAGSHQPPAECLKEQGLMTHDDSGPAQSQPGAGTGAASEELKSAAGHSAERLEEPAAAEHSHHSNGDMAEQNPPGSGGPMEVNVLAPNSAESASLAIHAADMGADPGSAAVQAPDVQMPEDEVPGRSVLQEELSTADGSGPAVAGDAA